MLVMLGNNTHTHLFSLLVMTSNAVVTVIVEPDVMITTSDNNSTNVKAIVESKEDPCNQNDVALCGTCPDIPYNIATHYCVECKENICKDCKHGHGIFRATRDHIISPL